MTKTRMPLAEDVYLTYVPAVKFKTDFLSAQFITPLRREAAGLNALLSAVLERGCVRYPDMQQLSAALDLLYGANVEHVVRKRGENQLWGFVATCVDDAYLPDHAAVLEPLGDILGELICHPVLEDGRLKADYVLSERTNLLDAIRSVVNDKRALASKRLLEEMCRGEPYGLSHIGEEADVAAITPEQLTDHYRSAIASSRLELYYCGRAELERVVGVCRRIIRDLPRSGGAGIALPSPHSTRGEPQVIRDQMDVAQGKLGVGFTVDSSDKDAVFVMNTMFGGTSNSKLFLNVREKLSLCYYASSAYHRSKNLITVSSGIEFENYQKALDEILAQLEAMRRGDWEEWELTGARSCIANGHQSMADSASRMEDFYMGQVATGRDDTPESLMDAALAVTPERIMAAARATSLDTIYFLTGKEAQQDA